MSRGLFFIDHFATDSLLNVPLKEFRKSVSQQLLAGKLPAKV